MSSIDQRVHEEKKERVRRRWKILSDAVTGKSLSKDSSSISGFQGFGMFKQSEMADSGKEEKDSPFVPVLYESFDDSLVKLIMIHRREGPITLKELSAADNTGNIRVWPSEEVMGAYLSSSHFTPPQGKFKLLEIGAGMSGMGGLAALQNWESRGSFPSLYLSDGNGDCVKKLNNVVQRNVTSGLLSPSMKDRVHIKQIEWERVEQSMGEEERNSFRLIICADCVFLENYHDDLLDLLKYLLCKDTGEFVLLAPPRGGSRRKFKQKALDRGFKVEEKLRFYPELWKRHLYFLDHPDTNYLPLQHCPSLLTLVLPSIQ